MAIMSRTQAQNWAEQLLNNPELMCRIDAIYGAGINDTTVAASENIVGSIQAALPEDYQLDTVSASRVLLQIIVKKYT